MIDRDGHFIHDEPEYAHLAGNTAGGNPNTWYPELWAWMVRCLDIESVYDVGCGEGHAMREFERLGCSVGGCDGSPRNAEIADAACVDFTREAGCRFSADLIWCCEVVGQVEERYVPNILRSFRSKYVALTHQLPGQAGYHVVNGQVPGYWKGAMAVCGYERCNQLSMESWKHGKTYWTATGWIYGRIDK